jgi:DNA polymerase-3 subunit delta
VKLTARQVDGFLASPDPSVHAILVYGPDSGLVRERVDGLLSALGVNLSDPFRVSVIDGAELGRSPGVLTDEILAVPFGGGRKIVIVRGSTDGTASIVADHLAYLSDNGIDLPGLAIFEAGELTPRSRLRTVFEKATNAVAIPSYLDDPRQIEALAKSMFSAAGIRATHEALDFLSSHLGDDRTVSRRELEKIVLYIGPDGGVADLDAVAEIVVDSSAHVIDDLVMATAAGALADVDRGYSRCRNDGQTEISILRAHSRHFDRLHRISGLISEGVRPEDALSRLRPPVFFKHKPKVLAQTRVWSRGKIETAIALLLDAERECKGGDAAASTICHRTLLRVANAARG